MQQKQIENYEKKRYGKRMRLAGFLSAGLLLLCGCTRKEELLLLEAQTQEPRAGQPAFSDETEETGETAFSGSGSEGDSPAGEEAASQRETLSPETVCVHVCGAVERPGVYELPAGGRVYEAVQEAGGFAQDADRDYVNQAQILPDGVKLVIPTLEEAARMAERGTGAQTGQDEMGAENAPAAENVRTAFGIVPEETASVAESVQEASPAEGRININTATEAELCNIPGIGATRAAAIAAYRESHGGFQKPEDIMQVNGIKEGMYEKIKDSIRVN